MFITHNSHTHTHTKFLIKFSQQNVSQRLFTTIHRRSNFSQQFPDYLVNTPLTDIIPVFPPEEESVEEQQDNPSQLTEEQVRLLEQDAEVRRETKETEL